MKIRLCCSSCAVAREPSCWKTWRHIAYKPLLRAQTRTATQKRLRSTPAAANSILPIPQFSIHALWRYDAGLDGDLVVITPAMEGDTGLDAAGELPLAEEPRFPEAKPRFLQHLRDQGQAMAQQAMLEAMAAGN